MSFRGFQIDSSGRLRIKNAGIVLAGSGDPCCCVGSPTVTWYAIFPCDDFAGITGDICCDGNCYWITAVRYCELLQDAIDSGDIPSSCVTAPDGDGLCDLNFAPDTRDSSLCDLNTPDYFVVWNNLTQSCYRLYIRQPYLSTITPCRTASTADYSTVPTGGIDGTNAVTYVGVDCCDSPCTCDGLGNPDPPQPDPTPDPTYDDSCCAGSTNVIDVTVTASSCGCTNLGPFQKLTTNPSGTYRIANAGGCFWQRVIGVTINGYSDSGCVTWASRIKSAILSVSFDGTDWTATLGGLPSFNQIVDAPHFGTCPAGGCGDDIVQCDLGNVGGTPGTIGGGVVGTGRICIAFVPEPPP